MTKIEAQIPNYLAQQALALAEREKVPLDHIIALALSAQVAAWHGSDDIRVRARRPDFATGTEACRIAGERLGPILR
jgi:hypothetical protein